MNLFFPSHDIALGNGVKHFNPPAAAQRLQEDLAWLEDIFDAHTADRNWGGSVWGWDWDTRQYLHKERHVNLRDLPTDDELELIRQLSNRRTTIKILQGLKFGYQIPEYLSNEEELDKYIEQRQKSHSDFVLKTPWSSSGRGLIRSSNTPLPILRQRALATIRKMGGIMAEQWFDKQQDFAMLFDVDNQQTHWLGYSLFDNEENGTYRQGYLLSNEEIENRITSGNDMMINQLHDIRNQLTDILNELFHPLFGRTWHIGFVGIDMMTIKGSNDDTDSSTQPIIHPCIELNLRCTMGIIARLWSNHHLATGQTGRFLISPMEEDGHFVAQFQID